MFTSKACSRKLDVHASNVLDLISCVSTRIPPPQISLFSHTIIMTSCGRFHRFRQDFQASTEATV